MGKTEQRLTKTTQHKSLENNYDNTEMQELLNRYERFLHSGADSFLDADEFAEIADYYSEQGEEQKAVGIIDNALEIYPDDIALLAFKSRACLFIDHDPEAAERVIELAQDKTNVEYHYVKAEILLYNKDVTGARQYLEDYYDNVVATEPTDEQDDYFYDVASLFFDYGQYPLCWEWLKKSEDKENTDYKILAARTLFQLNRYEESEVLYDQVLDELPFDSDLWHEQALSQLAQDKVSEALTSTEYALAIEPGNEEAFYTKAHCMMLLGNLEDASLMFDKLSKEPS